MHLERLSCWLWVERHCADGGRGQLYFSCMNTGIGAALAMPKACDAFGSKTATAYRLSNTNWHNTKKYQSIAKAAPMPVFMQEK